MRNWKTLALGFVAGATCMVTTTAIAAGIDVSAYLSGDITFKINDVNMPADPDMPVLNYKGYTYVPTRFIADKLGCTIDFDPVLRQVVITSPEPEVIEKIVEKEVEKIVYVDKDDDPDGDKVYSKLPINYHTDEYKVTITGVTITGESENSTRSTDYTKVHISVENKGQYNIQVVNSSAKLIVDDKEYKLNQFRNLWDQDWYNDIRSNDGDDSTRDGYLLFDMIPRDWSNATLTFDVRRNGAISNPVETLEFNFRR